MARSLADRFWARIDAPGSDECWYWRGYNENGHGTMIIDGRVVPLRRVAWQVVMGDAPERASFEIACGDYKCLNPAHMRCISPDSAHVNAAFLARQARFRRHEQHAADCAALPVAVLSRSALALADASALNTPAVVTVHNRPAALLVPLSPGTTLSDAASLLLDMAARLASF